MNTHLTKEVCELALAEGAALVGFAPISRFANAPADQHPRTIFLPTRTAIAIALPQARGALKAVEEGCYWQAYNCDSYWYLSAVPELLDAVNTKLDRYLEDMP